MQYKVNINACNVAISPIIMSPQQIIAIIIQGNGNMHTCTCSNVLIKMYTSAYFNLGSLMKALEINGLNLCICNISFHMEVECTFS